MKLPHDVPRCQGLRTSYAHSVRPLDMCQGCERWKQADTGGIRTPHLVPGERVTISYGLMSCGSRLEGAPDEVAA